MKSFLEEYGFAILAAIVVVLLIVMASPVGNTVRDSLEGVTTTFGDKTENMIGKIETEAMFGVDTENAEDTALPTPDANQYLDVYYANFMNWLINDPQNVNLFYKDYRWNGWKQDCENLNINQGISFYPLLVSKCDIEQRSKKVVSMNELIKINM